MYTWRPGKACYRALFVWVCVAVLKQAADAGKREQLRVETEETNLLSLCCIFHLSKENAELVLW